MVRFPGAGSWGLVTALLLAVTAVVVVSYRAVVEWQRSAATLATQRADATVDLLMTALLQDMRAVQVTVLSDQRPDVTAGSSTDTYDLIASAFGRYPYPEAFFTWTNDHSTDTLFYIRSDRYPAWLVKSAGSTLFPVSTVSDPGMGRQLLERIQVDARLGRRYSTFDSTLGACRCQVIALLSYGDVFRQHLRAAFGFVVDLAWVRQHYFPDLAAQVTRIGGGATGLQLVIRDGQRKTVAGPAEAAALEPEGRGFPLLFFDPRLVALDWPTDLDRDIWTVHAKVSGDPAVAAANLSARRTLIVATLMAVVAIGAVVAILHSARASAELARIRSEFVSTVTHELKTPLATIQAISETFASGRGVTPELSKQYGHFSVHEAKRLRRLIDNLLAYARITDVADVYSFEALDPHFIVEQTLRDFGSQLEYSGFAVHVEVPADLPRIRADRRAIGLALGNIVDNAIRYSTDHRYLGVHGHAGGHGVVLRICDRGVGIPADDIPLVTRKFFTGNRADRSGSGLGLAIVERIVTDHGGSLSIQSGVGTGTTVTLDLPSSKEAV
jgi:signal transduction histidine kinase